MLPEQYEVLELAVRRSYTELFDSTLTFRPRLIVPDFRGYLGARVDKFGLMDFDGKLELHAYGEFAEPPVITPQERPTLGNAGEAAKDLDCLADLIAKVCVETVAEALADDTREEPSIPIFLQGQEVPRVFSNVPEPYREVTDDRRDGLRVRFVFGVLPGGAVPASG